MNLSTVFNSVSMNAMSAQASSALVPYDESKIQPHHRSELSFSFGDVQLRIKQTWETDGVAGVVWDAVSSTFIYWAPTVQY